MTEKIDLEVQYTVEDYVRGTSFILNRHSIVKYGFLILPLIPLMVSGISFLQNPDAFYRMSWKLMLVNFAPVLVLVVFLAAVRFYSNPFLKWNLQRQFKSSPLLREKQDVAFDETGIKGETALSSAVTKWDAVIEATETERDFFFFVTSKKALFVPKRAFADEFQMNLLRSLARMKLGDRAKF